MTSHPLTELFFTVVSVSWRAGWLILVLAVLRLAVRGRVPAQVWFAAWILVAVRLVLPFSIPAGWSPYNFFAAQPPAETSIPQAPLLVVSAPAELVPTVTAPQNSQPQISLAQENATLAPVVPNVVAPPWSTAEMLAAAWLAGVAVLAMVRMGGLWNFRCRLRDARPVVDGRVAALVESERKRADGRGRLALEETGAVDAPALYGLMRPRLLLPPNLAAKLTDEEFRHVVRHELGHWRRRDLLAQELMQAAVALHWFNPLAWLAARLARVDCELACDEFVLGREGPGGATAYGATLLKVLGVVRRRRRPVAVVAMLEGREQLAQRIRMIAGYRAVTLARVVGGVALIAILTVASLTRETRAADKAGASSAPSSVASGSVAAPASGTQAVTGTDETAAIAQRAEAAKAFADLTAVVDPQKRKVDQLARDLQAYKEKHNWISPDTRKDIASDTLKALSRQLQEAEVLRAEAEIRFSQVKECRERGADLKDLPFIANQPLVAQLTQQQAAAKIVVGTLRQRYGEAHPDMVNAASNLAQIEGELQRAVESACRQVEAEYQSAQRNAERAGSELNRAKAEALALDRGELEYRTLESELQTQEQILQDLTARARVTALAPATRAANGTVTISIDQDGVVSVNGRSATNDQLPGLLKEAHDIDRDVPVLIQASETTPLQKLAFVMEACRKAGLNKFSLQSR